MINIVNIRTIAVYERKTLFRSWFFRIFAILSLLILFGMNMGTIAQNNAHWTIRAIAANIPYINVLFVNVAQAIIAVFLASDFMQRDKKLDTTEVIYARPISNGEYVVGKTWGIVSLFIGLLIAVLSMALIFNLLVKDTPVVWEAYLLYPLLIAIPTLVFILGLSFFLMILLRSQAVTFLILLGYIGLSLFYFKNRVDGLFDYMAFSLPMVYSDFIGFGDFQGLLIQRLAYLFLGLGFIFATIRFLNRLPQTGHWDFINLAGFMIFVFAGLYAGGQYYTQHKNVRTEGQSIMAINTAYAFKPKVDVQFNNINVDHTGRNLIINSQVVFQNTNLQSLDTIIFSLNPGFNIDSITGKDEQIEFLRKGALTMVIPEIPLQPWGRLSLNFHYHGMPSNSVAYLDVDEEEKSKLKRIMVATLDKMPGMASPEYIMLTKELLWYPVAGVGFNKKTFQQSEPDFSRFQVSVKTREHYTAICPGERKIVDGLQVFSPEKSLNTFPLVIGPYEERSDTIKGVTYSLYYNPGHDFFTGQFDHISDTLDAIITDIKERYEYDELDLYYQFKRLKLVEVPVQFHPYERAQTQYVENIQPEMIFMPEKGAGLRTLDFARFKKAEEKRNKERESTSTPEEIEINLLKNFLENTFTKDDLEIRRGFRGRSENLLEYDGEPIYSRNPYSVFPLYYSLVAGIHSRDYPLFNTMIETYLKDGYEISIRQSFRGGITENERANLALKEKSLVDILADSELELGSSAIYQAGNFILTALRNRVGAEDFDYFLYYYLEDHGFSDISFDKFSRDFLNEFGISIEPYLDFIKSGTELPEFIVSDPEFYLTRDEYGDVYVVKLSVSNVGGNKGLINLSFMISGQRGFGGKPESDEKLYEIDAGTTREIQAVFYEQPRVLTVNTVMSGNIPLTFSLFLRSAKNKNINSPEDYDKVVPNPDYSEFEGEIIVDNEDEGFSYITQSQESKLKQFIDSKKPEDNKIEYAQINPYWSPLEWTNVAHSAMYGTTVRSAMVTRAGKGENRAMWKTLLPETGFYDVYVYIPTSAMYSRKSSRGSRGDRSGRRSSRGGPAFADNGTEYNYVISSAEGTEEVTFPLFSPEEGWNLLGTFHFPADTAVIELSNNTNGKRVFADAVKWVVKD